MDWGAFAGLLLVLTVLHVVVLMLLTVTGASTRVLTVWVGILVVLSLSAAGSTIAYVTGAAL